MLLGGRYETVDRIGVGGSAAVYRAHDRRLGRDVAVKVLDLAAARSADPPAVRRFEVEALHAATFVHPHAVTIFDAGTDGGQLYIVMELVAGGSLAERLLGGPLTSSEVRTLGTQLAGALDAAHSAGIIHRDVKPSNVLLDERGDVKLADFGIARRLDEIEQSLTSTGMVMGTRRYVSPEQARGATLDPATDVFSLGVTLYEAATGTSPPSAVDRAPDHLLDPRSVVAGFDAGLARVIATASAMPVERRFATAAAMGDALADPSGATDTMPIFLRPDESTNEVLAAAAPVVAPAVEPTLSRRLADDRRRRSIALAAGALVAVLTAVAIAVALARTGERSTGAVTPSAGATSGEGAPAVTAAPAPVETVITEVVVTTAAPIPTTPPLAELIPGFPVPADAAEFLRSIEADPDLVGARGSDLAKEFGKVLDRDRGNDEDGDEDRGGRAGELRESITEWTRDGELDPVIAATAIGYVDAIAPPSASSESSEEGDDD